MQVKKKRLEPDMKQWTASNWERCTSRLYIVTHPAYLTSIAEYIMQNARLDEAEAGIKISRRSINNLRYADGTTVTPESEKELNSLLMRVREES